MKKNDGETELHTPANGVLADTDICIIFQHAAAPLDVQQERVPPPNTHTSMFRHMRNKQALH